MKREHSWKLADDLGALLDTQAKLGRVNGYSDDEVDAELAAQLGARLRAVEARRAQRREEQREREQRAAAPPPEVDVGVALRYARGPMGPESANGAAEAMALALDLERTLDDEPSPSWFVRVFCDELSTRALVKTEVELLLADADAADPRAIVDAVLVAAGPGWRALVDTGTDRRVDVRLWPSR